ncbi:MAG: Gfo/Idh/MocA family oxidoreductase [Anaerolineae bacterium]|nr:Gfo/Idh/MocA family oxidoreductase [Anaerolineae bacterium]
MNKIRIGVVGLRFGQHHVRTLANMEEARLVAVADRHPAVPGGLDAYARQYGARAYRDGVEMIEREALDAVSLCTSPRGRATLIEAAARKGVPMVVEKPWAADLRHARRLAELCRRCEARVMVAFSFRFHPAIARLRELLDGELGPAWMLNGEYAFSWVPPAGAGMTDWSQMLRLMAPHMPEDSWVILEHVQTSGEARSSLRLLRAAAVEARVTLA